MILEGTTASGAVVPVQVTTDGKVVAEGRTGPEGPQGPEGPEGPQGPEGAAGSPGNLWSGTDPGPIYYTGGSVGIGTTSPGSILNLQQSASAAVGPDFRLTNNAGSANDKARISFFGGTTSPSIRGALDFNIDSAGAGELIWSSGEGSVKEKFRCDASGRLLVGTSSSTTDDTLVLNGNSGTSGSDAPSVIRMRRTGAIAENNEISLIEFASTETQIGASIRCNADDAWSTGHTPARIVFATTANGTSTPTERMTIDSRGDIVFHGTPVMKSPDGRLWAVVVDNSGNLSTIAMS